MIDLRVLEGIKYASELVDRELPCRLKVQEIERGPLEGKGSRLGARLSVGLGILLRGGHPTTQQRRWHIVCHSELGWKEAIQVPGQTQALSTEGAIGLEVRGVVNRRDLDAGRHEGVGVAFIRRPVSAGKTPSSTSPKV